MGRFSVAPIGICAYILATILSIAATVLFLVFGILALVPTKPFDHREIATGVVLLVLGATGVAGIGGALVGGLFGVIIGAPCSACCGDDTV